MRERHQGWSWLEHILFGRQAKSWVETIGEGIKSKRRKSVKNIKNKNLKKTYFFYPCMAAVVMAPVYHYYRQNSDLDLAAVFHPEGAPSRRRSSTAETWST